MWGNWRFRSAKPRRKDKRWGDDADDARCLHLNFQSRNTAANKEKSLTILITHIWLFFVFEQGTYPCLALLCFLNKAPVLSRIFHGLFEKRVACPSCRYCRATGCRGGWTVQCMADSSGFMQMLHQILLPRPQTVLYYLTNQSPS